MFDVAGSVLYYAAVPAALGVMGLVVWWLRGSWWPLRLASAASLAVAAFLVLISLAWALALRDGFGPVREAFHSEGTEALSRSAAELPTPLLLAGAAFAALGGFLALVSLRQRARRGVTVG
jgi:hypothetical protein